MQFCFLKGICQREVSQFYSYIGQEKEDIVRDISSFFAEQIAPKFPLDDYVMDVVRHWKDRVSLVDMNPFGVTTDSLLFDWEEAILTRDGDGSVPAEFRFISQESGIRSNPLRHFSQPLDFVDLASGQDAHKLISLLNLRTPDDDDDEDLSD